MFSFTPLLGAQSTSPAVQSLLEFDGGIKILVDVGWDNRFDAEQLRALERQVPTISLVLLTHATVSHLGAYAHCCKHVPLFHQIPVYATQPVASLGRTLTQDLYSSSPLAASFLLQSLSAESKYLGSLAPSDGPSNILLPAPSSEDIASYFSSINTLRYSQVHQPLPSPWSPPIEGLTIAAYCAGHTLGGTIWHVQYGSESVVYAVDWNQGRENALPGAAWLGGSGATGAEIIEQLRRPTALICSSKGSGIVASVGGLKRRDELLLDRIRTAVQTGGSVLIPCDTSARVIELAYTLERAWASESRAGNALANAKLYFASTIGESTMTEARRMLEWMDESIAAEFEAISGRQQQGRDSNQGDAQAQTSLPFAFKHLKLVERQSQVARALATNGSKVFLISDTFLEWDVGRSILRHMAADSKSMVIFINPLPTDPQDDKTSGNVVVTMSNLLRKGNTNAIDKKDVLDYQCTNEDVELRQVNTVALSGKDLNIYQQYLAQQRQRQTTFNADKTRTLESSADVLDEQSSASSSSSEDSDPERQGKVLNVSAALAHSKHKLIDLTDEDLGINILLRRKNVHDYDVRGKKGREKMFPYVAKRRRFDDFGDLIRAEDYLRAEERDEIDGQDLANHVSKVNGALGQKRKWDESESAKPTGRRRSSVGMAKRRRFDNGAGRPMGDDANNTAVEDDESEESEYEPEEPILRGPAKATFSTQILQLNLKLVALDFFGIHDRRSLNMLMPLIRPRKLILIGGTKAETHSLAEDCRHLLASTDGATSTGSNTSDVLTPTDGVSVDASVDTNAWTIKLTQSLFQRLRWQNFRGLGIVTLSGRLELPTPSAFDNQGSAKRQKLQSEEDGDIASLRNNRTFDIAALPVLNDIPDGAAGTLARPVSEALHVGDLRLAELRRLMQASGHTAEFKGEGTLLVDGAIAVRKSGIGRIEVESGGFGTTPGSAIRPLGASFYDVRRKIYEGLAVVAAR